MPKVTVGTLTLALMLTLLTGCQPNKTVECIAPANPGGGWDFTCRSVGKIMKDLGLVNGTVRVTNMPGGGGGVAFAHVVTQRSNADNLLVAASTGTTMRIAQEQYGAFGPDDVRWLGALGADYGVIAVAADAPYLTLDDLIEAWRTDPASVPVGGGSAIGGQDHMKVLLLAKAAGIDPQSLRYVSFDGGGEALTALLGGFVRVLPGDASDVANQLEAGTVRILAVLAPERLPDALRDVPTARELGYEVEWLVWRGFYVPGGISDEAFARWTAALEAVAPAEAWTTACAQYQIQPFFLIGEAFETYVSEQIATLRALSQELQLFDAHTAAP